MLGSLTRLLTIACLVFWLTVLPSCDVGGAKPAAKVYELFAESASIGKWVDPRAPITQLKLVILAPRSRSNYFAPGTTVVITTNSAKLASSVDDIVSGKIPVPEGMVTIYALGGTYSVKIERIGEDGARVLVEEGRVNFLELVAAEK